jgi:hypothetical protein
MPKKESSVKNLGWELNESLKVHSPTIFKNFDLGEAVSIDITEISDVLSKQIYKTMKETYDLSLEISEESNMVFSTFQGLLKNYKDWDKKTRKLFHRKVKKDLKDIDSLLRSSIVGVAQVRYMWSAKTKGISKETVHNVLQAISLSKVIPQAEEILHWCCCRAVMAVFDKPYLFDSRKKVNKTKKEKNKEKIIDIIRKGIAEELYSRQNASYIIQTAIHFVQDESYDESYIQDSEPEPEHEPEHEPESEKEEESEHEPESEKEEESEPESEKEEESEPEPESEKDYDLDEPPEEKSKTKIKKRKKIGGIKVEKIGEKKEKTKHTFSKRSKLYVEESDSENTPLVNANNILLNKRNFKTGGKRKNKQEALNKKIKNKKNKSKHFFDGQKSEILKKIKTPKNLKNSKKSNNKSIKKVLVPKEDEIEEDEIEEDEITEEDEIEEDEIEEDEIEEDEIEEDEIEEDEIEEDEIEEDEIEEDEIEESEDGRKSEYAYSEVESAYESEIEDERSENELEPDGDDEEEYWKGLRKELKNKKKNKKEKEVEQESDSFWDTIQKEAQKYLGGKTEEIDKESEKEVDYDIEDDISCPSDMDKVLDLDTSDED